MPRARREIRLKRDPQKSGVTYWSALLWIENRQVKRSTGIIDDGTETARFQAETLARKYLDREKERHVKRISGPRLGEFLDTFWRWETSDYIRAILARDPRAITQEHCRNQLCLVRLHVRPFQIPRGPRAGRELWDLRPHEITADILDQLVTYLLAIRSTQTVKHVVSALSVPFDRLVSQGFIPFSPVKLMLPFTVIRRRRDAYTVEECRRLLNPETYRKIWGDPDARQKAYRSGDRWYAMAVLNLVTGSRWNAVAALHREDIRMRHQEVGDFIGRYYEVDLTKSFGQIGGLKEGSKTGEGVTVVVPAEIMERILPFLPDSGPLFPSFGRLGIVSHQTALRHLKEAHGRAGIGRQHAKERLLGFHSFRHTFVTEARRSGLSKDIRRAFTEHAEDESEDGYTHLQPRDLLVAGPLQRSLIMMG